MIKLRTEINKIETYKKSILQEINKTQSLFLEKIHKIVKLLTKF